MTAVGILVAIALAIAGYALFGRGSSSAGGDAGTPPPPLATGQTPTVPVNPSMIPSSGTITLGTQKGLVTVNNFYNIALGIDADTLLLANDPAYQITYDRGTSIFSIVINSGEADARASAEAKFLEILGIQRNQACNLATSETVAGTKMPSLSFCSQ